MRERWISSMHRWVWVVNGTAKHQTTPQRNHETMIEDDVNDATSCNKCMSSFDLALRDSSSLQFGEHRWWTCKTVWQVQGMVAAVDTPSYCWWIARLIDALQIQLWTHCCFRTKSVISNCGLWFICDGIWRRCIFLGVNFGLSFPRCRRADHFGSTCTRAGPI